MFDALRRGRCAAAVYDAPILAAVKAERPKAYGQLIGRIPTDERYGIVFAAGLAAALARERALREHHRRGDAASRSATAGWAREHARCRCCAERPQDRAITFTRIPTKPKSYIQRAVVAVSRTHPCEAA